MKINRKNKYLPVCSSDIVDEVVEIVDLGVVVLVDVDSDLNKSERL